MTREQSIHELHLEYARTMGAAQHFEKALQAVAVQELDLPEEGASDQEFFERTERLFSRSIGWIQRRLDMDADFAQEIDELRAERNGLAHGFFVRLGFGWPEELTTTARATDKLLEADLPKHIASQIEEGAKVIEAAHQRDRDRAIRELQLLRARFEACNSTLYKRFLSVVPYVESWDEMERLLEDRRGSDAL
jgi:hypothetical protein